MLSFVKDKRENQYKNLWGAGENNGGKEFVTGNIVKMMVITATKLFVTITFYVIRSEFCSYWVVSF